MQPRHNTRGESSPDHDDPSSALFDDDSVQLCSFVSLLTDGSDLISSIGKWIGLKTRKNWASESRSLEHFMLCKYLIIVEMFSCRPLLPSFSPLYLISVQILENMKTRKINNNLHGNDFWLKLYFVKHGINREEIRFLFSCLKVCTIKCTTK